MKIGSLLGTKPYSPTRLNENENWFNWYPAYTVPLHTSRTTPPSLVLSPLDMAGV